MSIRMPLSRVTEIARARQRLERFGWPRLQMAVIVLVTAAVGLLASSLFRTAGIESMLLRYPLAILTAYGMFLLLMWAWIRWRDDAVIDTLDIGADLATSSPRGGVGGWTGSGGGSGGAGSSASWGASADSTSGLSTDASVLDVVDGDAGLPLLAILALAAVAVVAVVAAGWIVWTAPVLMAELIVDAAIAGGLYRRMQGAQAQGWWWLCVRHTLWPLLGVIGFFAALGGILQYLSPESSTLLEALRAL